MIQDPDYARAFTIARCIAWSYGYALLQHGTGTRDLDLLMVPWDSAAAPAEGVIRQIAAQTKTKIHHEPGSKPHGRIAWTLHFPDFGDPRWIDLSVMPRARKGGNLDGLAAELRLHAAMEDVLDDRREQYEHWADAVEEARAIISADAASAKE